MQKIRHIIDIHDGGHLPCADVRASIRQKIADIVR
ncbi:MAG: hypothetical protein AB4040_00720 [Synechococcus sp.]